MVQNQAHGQENVLIQVFLSVDLFNGVRGLGTLLLRRHILASAVVTSNKKKSRPGRWCPDLNLKGYHRHMFKKGQLGAPGCSFTS